LQLIQHNYATNPGIYASIAGFAELAESCSEERSTDRHTEAPLSTFAVHHQCTQTGDYDQVWRELIKLEPVDMSLALIQGAGLRGLPSCSATICFGLTRPSSGVVTLAEIVTLSLSF
jgi:hypothetical protein